MDNGTLALLIPIVALSIPIVRIWTKHQAEVAKMQIGATADATAEKAAQYSSQVKALEDRVRVLERIVTDKGYDVATQIEALRDQQRVEELLEERRDSGASLEGLRKERVQ